MRNYANYCETRTLQIKLNERRCSYLVLHANETKNENGLFPTCFILSRAIMKTLCK
jgi:hypothetical protein